MVFQGVSGSSETCEGFSLCFREFEGLLNDFKVFQVVPGSFREFPGLLKDIHGFSGSFREFQGL